jgi:tRNA(fMet)-specific endonuclease VapC
VSTPPTGSAEGSARYLLDTNIVIALFAGETTVVASIRAADVAAVPVIVLGELYYGARKSARAGANLLRLAAFAAAATVVPCDAPTAEEYGEIKTALRSRGTPIPENDLWIAALARQHGLTLATRDAHFDVVPGLTVARW